MFRSVISNVPSVQPTLRINPLNHAVVICHPHLGTISVGRDIGEETVHPQSG